MRPPSIALFEKLYLAVIAIGIVEVALNWGGLVAQARARLPKNPEMAEPVAMISAVGGILISLSLWYFVARRAATVAKWLVVLFAALGIYSLLGGLTGGVTDVARIGLGLAGTLLQVYAAWLLFRPDAVAWFESKGGNGPNDQATLD